MYHICAHKVSTHITLSKLECRIVYHPFCHIRLGTSEDGLVFDLNADVILATFARLDSAAGPESSSLWDLFNDLWCSGTPTHPFPQRPRRPAIFRVPINNLQCRPRAGRPGTRRDRRPENFDFFLFFGRSEETDLSDHR